MLEWQTSRPFFFIAVPLTGRAFGAFGPSQYLLYLPFSGPAEQGAEWLPQCPMKGAACVYLHYLEAADQIQM